MLELQESVDVWVFFKKNIIKPYSFKWRNRQIKITKINLVHTSKEGGNVFYHFSVSAGDNFYRLKLDINKTKWVLEEVDEDDNAY